MKPTVLAPQSATVKELIEETPETKSLVLEPELGPLQFAPGQFVMLEAEVPEKGSIRRAYSIGSSPLDPELLLTVKKMGDGILSPYLCEALLPGDVLRIRGPYGAFTLSDDSSDVFFVAAGSGIVPFRSMRRYVLQRRLDTRIALLYASKSLPYVIYRDELDELARHHRVVHTLTRNDDPRWTGYSRRIDRRMLVEVAGDFNGKRVYVCGPPAMCSCVVGYLRELNVPPASVKTEKY